MLSMSLNLPSKAQRLVIPCKTFFYIFKALMLILYLQVALDEFTRHGLGQRVNVSHRDVYVEGLGVEGVADAVFLDLPKPWEALPHALSAVRITGGRICSFSPCIEQVSQGLIFFMENSFNIQNT